MKWYETKLSKDDELKQLIETNGDSSKIVSKMYTKKRKYVPIPEAYTKSKVQAE